MATQGDYLSLPARSIGVWPVGNATAWAYGSWYQLIDKLDSGIFVSGIQFQIGAILATLDTTRQILFEVGVGAPGSEVIKMQIPYSIRLDTAVGYYKSSGYNSIFLPEPMLIPAGSRIAVRVADSFALAVTYDGFKLMYREIIDPVIAANDPSDGLVANDRTPTTMFTGASEGDAFNLEYKIQVNRTNNFSTNLVALGLTGTNWYTIEVDPLNNDIYAGLYNGDVYKQTGGTGGFVAMGLPTQIWTAIAIDPVTKDVYAAASSIDIYKRTGGVGSFVALGQSAAAGTGLGINPVTHDVYSGVNGGDIYIQTGGVGNFVALGAGTRMWGAIVVNPANNDVYIQVKDGDIYKRAGGVGSFVALNQVYRAWAGMGIDSHNNIYALANLGDLYIQYNGTGDFIPQGYDNKGWSSLAVNSVNDDIYMVHLNTDIYKQSNPALLLEKKSVSSLGFTDVTNGANVNPFPSNEQISYSIQMEDILGPGVYYWRVSARDPLGTNFYRSWTVPRSFTVLTGPKRWDGSVWDYKPMKAWDGNSWVVKPIKVWNGTSWVVKG